MENLVFGQYVTSATFCLKLGKGEIAALARLHETGTARESLDAAFWSLSAKGLVATHRGSVALTEAGRLAVDLLKLADLIGKQAKAA